MTNDQLMNEIRDANLSYLMLAQKMIQSDKAQSLFRLGLSEPVAELIAQLSPQQLLRISSRNLMMCTIRFDDELIWGLLADQHVPRTGVEANASQLHASVLMAGQHALAA